MSMIAAGLMALAQTVAIESAPVVTDGRCRIGLQRTWPALVDALDLPVREKLQLFDGKSIGLPSSTLPESNIRHVKAAIAENIVLQSACAGSVSATLWLKSIEARLRYKMHDYPATVAALDGYPSIAPSVLVGQNIIALMRAASEVNDRTFAAISLRARAAHSAAMVAAGAKMLDGWETDTVSVDAFRTGSGWIYIGWWKTPRMPVKLTMAPADYDTTVLEARWTGCNVELSPRDATPPTAAPNAALMQFARAQFVAITAPSADNDVWDIGSRRGSCLSLDKILPAFGSPYSFIGNEFAHAGALEPKQATRLLHGSPAQRSAATDIIVQRPDLVEPFELIPVIQALLERGDRLRAAFYYYVWRARSGPWAKFGPQDSAPALRGAIAATLGPVINGWIGSDHDIMVDTMVRAVTFERRMPLYPGRPDGATERQWQNAVTASRKANDPQKIRREFEARDWAAWENTRAVNGLHKGPLQSPGRPLPEDWR